MSKTSQGIKKGKAGNDDEIIIFRPFTWLSIECKNLNRVIDNGKITLPKVKGIFPLIKELGKLLIFIVINFIKIAAIFLLSLMSILYTFLKSSFFLIVVILFGAVSIVFALIGINIKAGALNFLLGNRDDREL